MRLWLDAQLSPGLAIWLSQTFGLESVPVRELGLREAEDLAIFEAARRAGAVIMTKDHDFVDLVERLGPPPQVIWVSVGNTSNARMQTILAIAFPAALELIRRGEPVVEISNALHGAS